MNNYEKFKKMNIDELAEWFDSFVMFDNNPYLDWFDGKYCNNCEVEIVHTVDDGREMQCSWCELNGKCKFFQDLDDIPDNKQMAKLWLESEE